MKKKFPGYYLPAEREFKEIWETCEFSFDANVLLNLYRYTLDTRQELIKVLKSVDDRIWIPHQTALEYHRNRIPVIEAQINAYEEIRKIITEQNSQTISKLTQVFQSGKHPFIKRDKFKKKLTKLTDEFLNDLDLLEENHPNLIYDDPIKDELTELFDGKVGDQFNLEEMEELLKKGKERYDKKIPPGYMDKHKDSPECYGDLILWFQIIKHVKETKNPLIFVTDDRKEDWWYRSYGKTIGPRPELISEIVFETGIKFYMYSADPFMSRAKQYLNQEIDEQAINEVEKFRKFDEKQALDLSRLAQAQDELLRNMATPDLSRLAQVQDELLRNMATPDLSRLAQVQDELLRNMATPDLSRIIQAQDQLLRNMATPYLSRIIQAQDELLSDRINTTQNLDLQEEKDSTNEISDDQ
jgi:hypothetical protein